MRRSGPDLFFFGEGVKYQADGHPQETDEEREMVGFRPGKSGLRDGRIE